MHWRIKGTVQKVLGHVPGGEHLHQALRRRFGGLADFGRECDSKVDDWRLMIGHLRDAHVAVGGATLLEIGTGWYPTFPCCLYLAGAERVHTLDIRPQLDGELVHELADRPASQVTMIAREAGRPPADVAAQQAELAAALASGASLDEASGGVIVYRAPADAAATGLPAGSVDVVFSNSVLEHMPLAGIEACFAEARRVLRAGGVMFHSVNCGDHYAYIDSAIDQLHYLQFSEAEWARWNNAFLYQNRLRAADFTAMARAAGFSIEIDTSRPSKERLAQLEKIEVDECFARYPREQLAITSIDFVGRKPS